MVITSTIAVVVELVKAMKYAKFFPLNVATPYVDGCF